MSLLKYGIFSTTVELGSLTRAAEALNLTQSGISHAISSLELEFGFPLLIRNRSGISLTSNGEYLLKYIHEILQLDEQLKQEVAAINGLQVGTVRIGTFTSVSTQWLPGVIKEFQNNYPSIHIKLLEGDYDEINYWIANGAVDFGFMVLAANKSFDFIPLKKDKMVCILPHQHPLGCRDLIDFREIKDEPFIMPKWGKNHDVRQILKVNKIIPNIRYEVLEEQAIIAMVQKDLGISILPEMAIPNLQSNICSVNLKGSHYRTIGIAAYSLQNLSNASQKFVNHLRAWLEEQKLLDFR
ncbi:LysR family transcriptional regulator [Natronincola ferrireducens]|uniref:DNA-binding transcriptional regulator, LysR family n=1 Tax=Natronincola ferrireducens TaxID=393762 RepID=A0A1G8ZFZ4_9FIRM|nr:LysR family transcriptional regulator [Natronincola ferrireducens]SDK13090.1 DNA-binding transcriptional regulator, LysR family [Natronincola ferrireducens]